MAASGEPWYEPTYHDIVVTGMATMVTNTMV